MHLISVCLAAAAVLFASGCASRPPNDYPAAYREAREQIPGHAVDAARGVEAFVGALTTLDKDGWESRVRQVYAPTFYFNDTLTTVRDIDDLVAHFEGVRNNPIWIVVHDTLVSGADVYVVWSMTMTLDDLGGSPTSDSIGVTHLRFDDSQRIVLHQDIWDSTQGFYQHLPIVGRIVRSIAARFTVED